MIKSWLQFIYYLILFIYSSFLSKEIQHVQVTNLAAPTYLVQNKHVLEVKKTAS